MLYIIKFLYSFVLPPGLFILAFALLSIRLYRRDKHSAYYLLAFTVLFYLFSTPFLGGMLVASLENRYHPPGQPSGDVIVMLGGGATADTPDVDGKGQLSGHAANRFLTTVRLHFQTGLPIILSGGIVHSDSGSEAEIAKRKLITLGVDKEKIWVEGASRNTEENAVYVKRLLTQHGFKKPILVTSAFHMERSVRNFAKQGIDVVPYPTDYLQNQDRHLHLNLFAPTGGGYSYLALKEYLGILALLF
ncbi:YdcF family protein [Ammoniphilus sp. YIM 78166]|uniref:YdcF family protein n=1 Tax=Ammoniphilus sp. YIM 78166 TaxID=1644106 RepID=UPI00106F7F19|nr:YdcF family protein [Ammoniphilus sp. YIM 78166]